ncbi:MAG: hypothetical protein ACOY4U_11115 [Pseudomonadota bacterium]
MKAILVILLLVVATIIGVAATHTVKLDGGYIVDVGSRVYDPVGTLKNIRNRLARDCSHVSSPSLSSAEATLAGTALRRHTQAGAPTIKLLAKSGAWLIAEAEFPEAEPGAFLLRKQGKAYKVVSVWGGSAAPFKDAPAIRQWFRSQAPSAPAALIECHEPLTPPFGPGTR